MVLYDFEFYTNRPPFYTRPRAYFSPYSPYSFWYDSKYFNSYKYYTPYRSTPAYSKVASYYTLPYRYRFAPSYSYIPSYYGPSDFERKLRETSVVPTESEKYVYKYGLNFDSTAKEIRDSTSRLLREIHQSVPRATSVPRFTPRASSLEPLREYDEELDSLSNLRYQRAVSQARLLREEPYYRTPRAFSLARDVWY
ncbi:CLUMA_CG020181, isoform A [Clunio marinus]|uniref:CLUMA_CG020181, isoform A n=1 Tax=Clunio marinus TaxID=568069 RepID=A0A1J1J6U4_9DIPT|nr:CLUMA_CG020181, isoform A [Clunio marinus]